MQSVDYKFWAKYLSEIHDTLGDKSDYALELAAGNCFVTKYLKSKFKKLIVSDISKEMLLLCEQRIDKVCCNMTNLPFSYKFDFIYSTFDSLNYLNTESKLSEFFENISGNLSENGFLTFDVSLKKNSVKHLKKLNREGKFKGIKYVQKSVFNDETNIHTNTLTITLKNGKTFTEIHNQKIYDFYYYFDVIHSKELYVAECFDAFTFNDATEKSDRVQFIVKRKN